MPNLLIVANCPSENTRKLHQAVHAGARHRDISGVETRLREPLEAGPGDVLWADGVILGTTENFGAISGLVRIFWKESTTRAWKKPRGCRWRSMSRAGWTARAPKPAWSAS